MSLNHIIVIAVTVACYIPVYIHMNTLSVIGLLNHQAADMISPRHITLAMYSLHTQTLYNKEGYIIPLLSHP